MASTPGKTSTDRPPDTHPEATATPQLSAPVIPTSQEQEEPLGAGPKRSRASSLASERTMDGLRPVYGNARIPGDESAHGGPVHLGTSKTMRTKPNKIDLRLALPGEVEAALAAAPTNQRPKRTPGLSAVAREEIRARQRAGPQFPQTPTDNTRPKRSQSAGPRHENTSNTTQAPPPAHLVATPQEARQSTPSAWEDSPKPVSPPPVHDAVPTVHDLRLQQAELEGLRLGREEADHRFVRVEIEALGAPQQLGGEWMDTFTRAEFEALDAEITALFKKGDVVAAERARQRQFRRGQEITQAQAGVPGPATNVVVDFAALPVELRFRQLYSNTAEVLQPSVAEPTYPSKAQAAEDIEHAYTQATAAGQAGYETQSTPADVERQRAPSPEDQAEGRGAPAHQPDAAHAVASLTRLVQECLDAFKGGLYAITCELNEREDRGVTDVEDAASRGLNAACRGGCRKTASSRRQHHGHHCGTHGHGHTQPLFPGWGSTGPRQA
jgi:hypothetical protein